VSNGEGYIMDSPTPTRAAKVYWALCAIIGGVLTVLVNVAHGLGMVPAPHTIPAGIVAAIPPLMTIALFEGYFLAKRCAPQHVLRVVMGAVIVLGGAAFSISYTSIAMFLNRQPGDLPQWTGWVMPALLDIFVVVSAYVYYVLAKHTAAPVVAKKRAQRSRLNRLADAATNRIEARLEAPESPQVEAPVEVHRAPVEAAIPSVEPVAEVSVEAVEPATKPSADAPVEAGGASAEPSVEPVVEVPAASVEPATKVPATPVRDELEPFMECAERIVEEKVVTRKTAEVIAEVIAAIERRDAPNRIKTDLGIAPVTTEKVAAAWQQWQQEHRALTAVG